MTPDHGRAEPPSSDAFRLLVENVTEYAIYMLDRDGYVLTWNAGGKRIKGYDADEILGKHFSIFYTAADAKRGKPDYALRIADGEGRFEDEGWRVRRDGSRFWAHVVITALRSPDGRLVGYTKITRDLTDQKRREDERAALLALERQAREDAQAGLDRIRAIQSVTEAALTFFSLDELLPELLERIRAVLGADTAAVLLLSEDGDVLIARAAKGLEEEVERNVRIPLGAGFAGRVAAERRPIVLDDVERADVLNPILLEKGIRSLVGVPLLVQSRVLGVLHVGTFRRRPFSNDDVELLQIIADRVALSIDHARLVAVATAARSEADAASALLRARDEFLSIAAHELKTPMTSAKTAAQLLARSFARSDANKTQQSRAIALIVQQIDKLSRLVTLLLETVRAQGGQLAPQRQRTNVVALIRGSVAEAQSATTAHELVLSAPESLWMSVDPFRLEQVMTNLLSNAIKFSPDGGRIDVDVKRPTPTHVWISVRDRGLGVAPEHREHLFERFFQAHRDRSGMGLGLYISRQIVEAHGGTIYAEFPPDVGARFVMSLPVGLHDVSEESAAESA
ncbi:MAG TPA: PAS domain-containing sensor histidine kinase [Gaiellaceae bacterium]|jgi:PAS domain S-box-containing protein|nr:PAS domain-containing sensor histidine kinase [Gaiellaceae bacterium]